MEKNTFVALSPVPASPITKPNPINWLPRTPFILDKSLIRAAEAVSMNIKITNIIAGKIFSICFNVISPFYAAGGAIKVSTAEP